MAAPTGNENSAKGKEFHQALKRALARKANESDYRRGLDAVADGLVEAAYKGEQWAIREIADRIDGRPVQAVTGEDGGPVVARIELVALGDG